MHSLLSFFLSSFLDFFELTNSSKIEAHDDDVNTVTYVDDSPNIVISGSDDSLLKMWDKRVTADEPVLSFVGHLSGVTHVCSKGDGMYFLSNSKDQTIKIWDLRKSENSHEQARRMIPKVRGDYRRDSPRYYRSLIGRKKHVSDSSVLSLHGHDVSFTLIRSYFSPESHTMGRFVYSGSADGMICSKIDSICFLPPGVTKLVWG